MAWSRPTSCAFRRNTLLGPVPLTFQNFVRQIQARKIRVCRFEQFENSQRLLVVVETTLALEALIEHIFARMAEWRMPNIMTQRERFNEILIELQRTGNGPCNRGNFERMCEPGPMVIAHVAREDLGFMTQPAKRCTVNDPIPITLVWPTIRMPGLRISPAGRMRAAHRVG